MADYTLALKITGDGRLAVQAVDEVTDATTGLGRTAAASGRQAAQSFTAVGTAAVRMDAQVNQAVSTLGKWAGALGGLHVATEFGGQVVEATNKLLGWQFGLQAATGDAGKAAEALAFVRQSSQTLGTSLEDNATVFTRLAAATKGTALEGAKTEAVFTSISEAARALHLSGAETSQALLALDQMMSKGTVQAQELKLQLGNVLPGASHVMAEALGVTTAQLNKMMDAGQVLAADALPKLAAKLHEIYGAAAAEAADAPAAKIQRLKNAVFELKAAVGNAGFMTVLGAAADGASTALGVLATNMVAVQGVLLSMAAGWAVSLGASRLAQAQTAKQAAAELAAAGAAEAEAAAELAKLRALELVTPGVLNLTRAEGALALAQARTAAATEAATVAGVGRVGLLARMGSGLLALVGGPIGAAVLAVGALATAVVWLHEKEEQRRAAFDATLRQFDTATQKAQQLHAALTKLADVPPPLTDTLKAYQDALGKVAEAQKAVDAKKAEIAGIQASITAAQRSTSGGGALLALAPELERARGELAALQGKLNDVRGATNQLGIDTTTHFVPALQAATAQLGKLRAAASVTDVLGDLKDAWGAWASGVDKTMAADAKFQTATKQLSPLLTDLAEKAKNAGKSEAQRARETLNAAQAAVQDSTATQQQKDALLAKIQVGLKDVATIEAKTKKTKDLTRAQQQYDESQRALSQKAAEAVANYINKTQDPLTQAYNDYANAMRAVAQAGGEQISKAIEAGKQGLKNADVDKIVAEAQRQAAVATEAMSGALERNIDVAKRKMDISGRMIEQMQQEAQMSLLNARDQAKARKAQEYDNLLREQSRSLTDDQARAQREQVMEAAGALYDMQQYAARQNQIAQEFAGFWTNAAGSISKAFADLITGQTRSFKDFGKALKSIAQQFVSDMVSQFLRLRVIGPILSGAMGSVAGWLGYDGDFSSALATLNPNYYGSGGTVGGPVAGVGGAGGGAQGGYAGYLQQGLQAYKAYQWASSGGLWGANLAGGAGNVGSVGVQGMTYGVNGASGGTAVAFNPYATSYSPVGGVGWGGVPYASYAGGALGAYYGLQRGDGGAGTVASTVGYGALGAGIAGTAAGVAGGMSVGTAAGSAFGAAAASTSWIPIVGWIMAALAAVDMVSGGKVFGTKYQTGQTDMTLKVGADGASAAASAEQWKYHGQVKPSFFGSLFGGIPDALNWGDKDRRHVALDVTPEMTAAAQQLYDGMRKVMVSGAQKLGVDVPSMIEASLDTQSKYNKKGKLQSTDYIVSYLGQTWKEATADAATQRLGADALLSVVAKSAGDVANQIAQQWQKSADLLQDGVQTLLQAQVDIVHGNSFVALGSAATLKEVIGFVQGLQADGEKLADTYNRLMQASQAYTQFVSQFAPVSNTFGASLEAIAKQMQANIDQANALAQAAGMQGAAEQDLVNIHQQAAQQAADAIAKLSSAAQDLAAKLYQVTGTSLQAVSAQLDAMQSKTQSALQLAIGDKSPLSGREKLDLALSGLRSGLTSADDVLSLGRSLYSSSADYTGLYNMVQSIVGAKADGTSQSVQDMVKQYNALSSQRDQLQGQANATARFADAKTLAQYIAEISTTHGIDYNEAAKDLGFSLSDLAKDLGVTNITGYLDQLKLQDIPGSVLDASGSIVDAIQKLGRDLIATITGAPITSATGVTASGNTSTAEQTALLKSIDQRLAAIEGSTSDTAATNKSMANNGASDRLNNIARSTRGVAAL